MHSDERSQVIDWETWQRAVELDGGSLWDVYVLGTDLREWQRLLDWLRDSDLPLAFERGGVPEQLPLDIGDIFSDQPDRETCILFIDRAGIQVNTHFFIKEEIELDIGLRDIRSGDDLARLQELLTGIARLLGKTVLVTPENGRDIPWFEISPDGATRSFLE